MSNKEIGRMLRKHYKDSGMTQPEVAAKFMCTQGQVNRIFYGMFTKRSSIAKKLCEDANIDLESTYKSDALKGVYDEILRLWDGTPKGAKQLQKTLSAIRQLKK